MEQIVKIDIQNCPKDLIQGYEVVTIIDGVAWHYGLYPDWSGAAMAAAGHEDRVILEVMK